MLALSLAALVLFAGPVHAAQAKIAIAANFAQTAKAIAAQFERDTGHRAVLIFGSTGKLYAQIYSGAPFDVFLAADQVRPQKALAEKLAVSDTQFTYAIGKITLYSQDPQLIDGTPDILSSKRFAKLAIANPQTAPYGAAAIETLRKLGLYNQLKSKIVKGENIAQTYQFVATGNAQLGFVANAQIMNNERGSRWLVPRHLRAPIKQDAVLLKHGANNKAAKAFLHYLKGEKARAIFTKHGYGIEE